MYSLVEFYLFVFECFQINSITEEKAIEEYKKGLSIMEEALRMSVYDSDCTGPDWDKARLLYKKMETNKSNIQNRLGKLGKL